jgi:hypothetical protein
MSAKTISVVKLEICELGNLTHQIIATMSDGRQTVFGNCKTMRGAKSRLTSHAKRIGLNKNDEGTAATR